MSPRLVLYALCALTVWGVYAPQGRGGGVPVQGPPPPTQQNGPPPTGIVLGTVAEAASGRPVEGAAVSLEYYGAVTPVLFGMAVGPYPPDPSPAPRRVLTDAEGHLVFREVAAGRYFMTASAAGYEPGSYRQTSPASPGHALELQDASRSEVQILIWKYSAITGSVVDEAGEPAVGVVVKAFRRVMSGGRMRLRATGSGVTDDRGIYRIHALVSGDYLVGVTSTTSAVPADQAEANADTGATAGAGVQMAAALLGLIRVPIDSGFRVGDLVMDASARMNGSVLPPPAASGPMQVYATTFFPAAASPAQATVVKLTAGEDRTAINLALNLVPASRISGTVMGPAGPVGGYAVSALSPSADDFMGGQLGIDIATTVTTARGAFQLLGVPAGHYVLGVAKAAPSGAGLGMGISEMQALGSSEASLWANLPITASGTDITDLAVTLRPGLRVTGRVEFDGSTTKPTPDAVARLFLLMTPLNSTLEVQRTSVTSDGQFASAGFVPGRYFAVVGGPGGGTAVLGAASRSWTLRAVTANGRNITDEPVDLESDLTDVVATFTDKTTQITGPVTLADGEHKRLDVKLTGGSNR